VTLPKNIPLWIDVQTGTWGSTNNLVFVEVSPEYLPTLMDASDQQINMFGRQYGVPMVDPIFLELLELMRQAFLETQSKLSADDKRNMFKER